MLPVSHHQSSEALLETLADLKKAVQSFTVEPSCVQAKYRKVQQVYQDRLVPLTTEAIENAIAPRWQSLQTEINRSLRLLQTDVIFLQASRQKATTEQRSMACLTRIEQLMGYCQELFKL
jgi:hypothetical protein